MNINTIKHAEITTTSEEDVYIKLVEEMLQKIVNSTTYIDTIIEPRENTEGEQFSVQEIEHIIALLRALRIEGLRF